MSEQLTDFMDTTALSRARDGADSRKLRSRKPRRRKVAKERPDKEEEEGQEQHEPELEPEQEPNPEDLMHLLMTALTVNPEEAGNILGIGRSSGYRAVRNKQIPSLKIGGKYLVSTAVLRQMLGIDPPVALPAPPPQPLPPVPPQIKPMRRRQRRASQVRTKRSTSAN